jgi:hypothetical protein
MTPSSSTRIFLPFSVLGGSTAHHLHLHLKKSIVDHHYTLEKSIHLLGGSPPPILWKNQGRRSPPPGDHQLDSGKINHRADHRYSKTHKLKPCNDLLQRLAERWTSVVHQPFSSISRILAV